MKFNVLLISTYEMGRQPFGLASPAAWLREAGATVRCLDLAIEPLAEAAVKAADLVAFFLPMHMATRLAVPVIKNVQHLNPQAHLCCFGLYAPVNAPYLADLGIDTIIGGEFEAELAGLVRRLSTGAQNGRLTGSDPIISLERQTFVKPDRTGLPDLTRYAQLVTGPDEVRPVGYTEASRGCKHLCRHCPIVPVYNGRFRIIQAEVVLADIRQQVEAGAMHVTFGDPDFFNGPGHAIPLVEALHREFPDLTYDVTIKVEHLLKHSHLLDTLKQTGCLFVTTAVEAFDPHILHLFDKQHTPAQFEAVLDQARAVGLLLVPTFVAFTPWTTLTGYGDFLAEIARLGLIEQVAPIQYSLRLLIPPGSRLLELPEMQAVLGPLDSAKLSYQWENPDPRLDQLQQEIERVVYRGNHQNLPRLEIFRQVWQRTNDYLTDPASIPIPDRPVYQGMVPRLTEPWYC
ncbi:MAG: CUAEP/CCAEP-tail radical SAM protein [Anaerolineae bacterium]|nr:CUAEP/CCAEP-tail radical SAM protein [Anaerolineae bacterium]